MMLFYTYSIAITKLDILDTFDEIKIGVAYNLNGKKIVDSFPGNAHIHTNFLFMLFLDCKWYDLW